MKTTFAAFLWCLFSFSLLAEDGVTGHLEEIIKLREQILKREMALIQEARLTSAQIAELKIELLNAKIDLETERGDHKKSLPMLEEILQLKQHQLEGLHQLSNLGRGDSAEIARQEISILQTRIRIARTQAKLKE